MEIREGFYYSKDHEWVAQLDGVTRMGVSRFAVEQLGDIVHLDLLEVGEKVEAGGVLGTIESTKTISDLFCPVAGEVVEVNEKVVERPELVQEDPYGEGWLLAVRVDGVSEGLLGAGDYRNYLESV